ncbi:probable anion transporter 4, chloroplastic [Populus nigra]|uniref:probable anion transporter 4, chloroplastic n=1 Tax=Populus nigra TaxID=3691 RepID=UPI002B26670F|nr:probable anion transporter 4, chloroplastic [Populus nigra]
MGCCLVVISYISYAMGGGYFIMGSTCYASNARHFADGVALPCMSNMIASLKGGEAKMLKKLYKPFLLDGSRRQNEPGLLGLQWLDFNFGNAIGLTQSPILLSKGSLFGPFISEYELEYILNKEWKSFPMENKSKARRIIPPFRRLLSKMPTWSLIVANTIHSWSLLPVSRFSSTEDEHHHLLRKICYSECCEQIYHVDLKHAAWFSAVPWRVMGFMGYFGGDPRHDSGVLRGTTNSVIYNEFGLILLVQDRILNTAGTLAAIVGTVGAGFFVELVGSFRGFLMLTSLLYFLAALFYNIFSTGENEF